MLSDLQQKKVEQSDIIVLSSSVGWHLETSIEQPPLQSQTRQHYFSKERYANTSKSAYVLVHIDPSQYGERPRKATGYVGG